MKMYKQLVTKGLILHNIIMYKLFIGLIMEGEKNLTATSKCVHFIGMGGTGMSAIANILLDLGYKVSGSDLKVSDALLRLKNMGAKVFLGHDAKNVEGADLVVLSTAIPPTNPEYIRAVENNIPVLHRADMLSLLMKPKKGIAVTGAHGKTTTTSMLSMILNKNGYDPTVIIGGEVNDIGGNATLGKGEYLVAEADESDGSFMKLEPYVAVVTNIENDHLDYYKNMERMKDSFKRFIENIKDGGFAILGVDNKYVREIIKNIDKEYYTFGIEHEADFVAKNIHCSGFTTCFDIYFRNEFLTKIELHVPGMHNVYNAIAATAVCNRLGIEPENIAKALREFRGVKRRFQVISNIEGIRVIDDYAHHPTEIKAVLNAAKLCRPRKIYAIFQPHRYSRTKMLAKDFGKAFINADEVIVTKIYSAGEASSNEISARLVVDELIRNGKKAVYIDNKEDIPYYLIKKVLPGDYVITIGAGDICEVAYEFSEMLTQTLRKGGCRQILGGES